MIISSGKTIYLSRHGQSQYNITKQLGGDSGLSNKDETVNKRTENTRVCIR